MQQDEMGQCAIRERIRNSVGKKDKRKVIRSDRGGQDDTDKVRQMLNGKWMVGEETISKIDLSSEDYVRESGENN